MQGHECVVCCHGQKHILHHGNEGLMVCEEFQQNGSTAHWMIDFFVLLSNIQSLNLIKSLTIDAPMKTHSCSCYSTVC